eukprot:3057847-Alexandrium_andersonii.AAC.1
MGDGGSGFSLEGMGSRHALADLSEALSRAGLCLQLGECSFAGNIHSRVAPSSNILVGGRG